MARAGGVAMAGEKGGDWKSSATSSMTDMVTTQLPGPG